MLDAKTPLSGFDETINEVRIRELSGFLITSLAVPNNGHGKFATAIRKATGIDCPEPGRFCVNSRTSDMLVWLSADQYFLMESAHAHPKEPNSDLGEVAYVTDQSDSWVMISVSGPRTLEALERICPINLHPDVFETGMATRTHMEHLGAVIMRTGTDEWWLMSIRSSAWSFLHAIRQSAENI